ncbi:hypothetical protein BBK36DRAFT_21163 [Trichoderma citrinoviride]|uniref:Uncharacterized protein n=1 Tax=Trichoderma citrinoviride TaxID=58853 RepID=A0A2T4B7R2_9HYPO|nr:hypothetical protein BBK36DRAFT_21163 [Trichoderma citrinoviride]PTB65365.1 hypothetical protein BBK36DRAFT_21163 [Trichoderma citrinoviride]
MAASSDSPSGASSTQQQHEAGAGASGAPEVDLAQPYKLMANQIHIIQALRDLARGEQAATAMEANLTNLESKLDALLAAFEPLEDEKKGVKSSTLKTGEEEEKK